MVVVGNLAVVVLVVVVVESKESMILNGILTDKILLLLISDCIQVISVKKKHATISIYIQYTIYNITFIILTASDASDLSNATGWKCCVRTTEEMQLVSRAPESEHSSLLSSTLNCKQS